jgi:hypothetical protein
MPLRRKEAASSGPSHRRCHGRCSSTDRVITTSKRSSVNSGSVFAARPECTCRNPNVVASTVPATSATDGPKRRRAHSISARTVSHAATTDGTRIDTMPRPNALKERTSSQTFSGGFVFE